MNLLNKTFLPPMDSKNHRWLLIDGKGQKLGRLATIITTILKGKMKPYYHSSIDVGDHIILINADSINLNKDSKHYLVYNPGRPGHSLKVRNVSNCPMKLTIERAVKGMLPTREKKRLMKRLKIYNATNHPHAAQNPIKLDVSNILISKN